VALVLLIALSGPALARRHGGGKGGPTPTPSPSPTPQPPAVSASPEDLAYDDPAIHFAAPPDFVRLRPAKTTLPVDKKVVIFAQRYQSDAQKTIVITIANYNGTLDGLEANVENDLRSNSSDSFIDKKQKLTLANGMPAWWVRTSIGQTAGAMYTAYEWIVTDGKRSIIASYTGHVGTFSEADARAALGSLAVVLYPEGR
jgi:hypothetical protein